MTKIKICGLTRTEDIKTVNKYLPDYVGFIFAPSKRQVTMQQAKLLISQLNSDIKKVGVFVNMQAEQVVDIAQAIGLDVIQLHGDENIEYIQKLNNIITCEIWKAVRVQKNEDIENAKIYPVSMLLLDKYSPESYGGCGERFDWGSICTRDIGKKIILAGGLDKDNVLEGIRCFKPYAIDVSSGVETNGFKDEEKIKELIEKVRSSHE